MLHHHLCIEDKSSHQPSQVPSDAPVSRHINTATQSPVSDGEDEVADDDELDEDVLMGDSVGPAG